MYIKTYIFNHFYEQYLVLLTMAPRNTRYQVYSMPGEPAIFFFEKMLGAHCARGKGTIATYPLVCLGLIGLALGLVVIHPHLINPLSVEELLICFLPSLS